MTNKTNYANEVELKSLLIRAKNSALKIGTEQWNCRISQLVKLFIQTDKWRQNSRNLEFRKNLKRHIIWACERTAARDTELSRLSAIVDLMIDRILTKPQFSGYTYTDEFHSDAQYKIFKYITNFDHKKISKISGDFVNAFAYITQIIHNSIIYVINSNKKHQERIKQEYLRRQIEFATENTSIKPALTFNTDPQPELEKVKITRYYYKKSDFLENFEQDLEKLDFSNIKKLVVFVPKGCDVANFVGNDIEFHEIGS